LFCLSSISWQWHQSYLSRFSGAAALVHHDPGKRP
jgi:hypothetical protein